MLFGLKIKATAAFIGFFGGSELIQPQSLFDQNFAPRRQKFVDETIGLAHVAGHFGNPDLGVVQLFKHSHRQVDMMFLEAEEG